MPKTKAKSTNKSPNIDLSYCLQLQVNCFNNPIPRLQISPTDNSNIRQCNVCNRFVSGGTNTIIQHLQGKRHKENLENLSKCTFLIRLRQEKPTLGLEYLLELVNGPLDQLFYVCLLCQFQGNEGNILDHVSSSQHTRKYLERHYPETSKKIHEHLDKCSDEIQEEFLKLACIIIADRGWLYNSMLPTVCFYKEFHRDSKEIYNLIESKLHLRESPEIVKKITDELEVLKAALEENNESDEDSGTDLILIEPEYPKIDLCDDDDSNTSEVMDKYLDDTESSLSSDDRNDTNMLQKPLTNTEIELLMANFTKLTSLQQKDLMKVLFHIKNTEPDRFKVLKSPFV